QKLGYCPPRRDSYSGRRDAGDRTLLVQKLDLLGIDMLNNAARSSAKLTQTDCVSRGCGRHVGSKSDALKKRLEASTTAQSTMDVLTIDVGAPHVKILGRGQKDRREFEPGPKLTP